MLYQRSWYQVSSGGAKVFFHQPGQALGIACLKAHAGLSAVKNEKEHTNSLVDFSQWSMCSFWLSQFLTYCATAKSTYYMFQENWKQDNKGNRQTIFTSQNQGNRLRKYLYTIHGRVSLFVISSIHKNFVEDLVQTWNKGDISVNHVVILVHPQSLCMFLNASHIGVWPQQNVLQLRLLLVSLLDGFIVVLCLCNVGIRIKFWTRLKRCPGDCLCRLAADLLILTSSFTLGYDHLVLNSNFRLDRSLLLLNSRFRLGHLRAITKIKKKQHSICMLQTHHFSKS